MPFAHVRLKLWCSSIAMLLALGFVTGPFASAAEPYTSRHENVLGTSLDLVIHAENPDVVDQAERAVLAEVDRLAAILSTWDKSSEFSRWRNGPAVDTPISPELFEVLSLCDKWKAASHGSFNASAQAVCALWKNAAKTGHR